MFPVTKDLAHAIGNPDNTLLNEQQKLDILERLGTLMGKKLPDETNIRHNGYLVLCRSAIERAKWKAAKRSRTMLKREFPQIVNASRLIPNIADRVFVMSLVGEDLCDFNKEQGEQLVEDARALAVQIPNVKDRIGRLENIADAFGKLRNTGGAKEAVNLAVTMTADLGNIEHDQILASAIQLAHEFDHDLAAQLTEKIENPWKKLSAEANLKALDLAKQPQRIIDVIDSFQAEEVLSIASEKMMTALVAGRNVVHPSKVLIQWLSATSQLHFEPGLKVANWAIESLIRQSSVHERNNLAVSLLDSVFWCTSFIYDLGNRLGFFSIVPEGIRHGFQGLSTRITVFRAGEREKALTWIRNWLKENTREYLKICDPYFDPQQLWILQTIPTSVNVAIVSTRHSGDMGKITTQHLAAEYKQEWDGRYKQAPPPTLLVIHDHTDEDEYHDRVITTSGAGLSIGTSLNGIGNQEFMISMLTPEDVKHIEENYINPKLDIQRNIAKATFFKLGDN